MNKKFYSKDNFKMSIFGLVGTFLIMVYMLSFTIYALCIQEYFNASFGFAGTLLFLLATLYGFRCINRNSCYVWYDEETCEVCRKGYFCGYEAKINVADIKEVIGIQLWGDFPQYVFVGKEKGAYDSGHKRSYIRVEQSPESELFIRTFYDGPIIQYDPLKFPNSDAGRRKKK